MSWQFRFEQDGYRETWWRQGDRGQDTREALEHQLTQLLGSLMPLLDRSQLQALQAQASPEQADQLGALAEAAEPLRTQLKDAAYDLAEASTLSQQERDALHGEASMGMQDRLEQRWQEHCQQAEQLADRLRSLREQVEHPGESPAA